MEKIKKLFETDFSNEIKQKKNLIIVSLTIFGGLILVYSQYVISNLWDQNDNIERYVFVNGLKYNPKATANLADLTAKYHLNNDEIKKWSCFRWGGLVSIAVAFLIYRRYINSEKFIDDIFIISCFLILVLLMTSQGIRTAL